MPCLGTCKGMGEHVEHVEHVEGAVQWGLHLCSLAAD
jgi:hypothetical protein